MKYTNQVSIIIPCYNAEKFIKQCIDSIKLQTYDNFLCYLVNDGSKDKTDIIIKEEIKDDSRFIYINKENGGASSARNAALNLIKTEYVVFVDCDDYVSNHYLERLLDFPGDSIDLNMCFFKRIYPDKESINTFSELDMKLSKYPAPYCKLFNTKIIKEHNLRFPEGLQYEDLYFFFAYVNKVKIINIVPEVLYNYVQYDSSVSHTANKRIYEIFDIFHLMEKETNDYELLEYQYIYHILIATVYKASFLPDFLPKTIKDIYFKEHSKYPNWFKNKYVSIQLSWFYKTYLWFLDKRLFFVIFIVLKLFNKKVHL